MSDEALRGGTITTRGSTKLLDQAVPVPTPAEDVPALVEACRIGDLAEIERLTKGAK